MGVPVGGDAEGAQVADELFGLAGVEVGGVAHGPRLQEAEQVVRRGAGAVDGLDGGAEPQFVMLQPAPSQFRDRDGLEAQGGGGRRLRVGR